MDAMLQRRLRWSEQSLITQIVIVAFMTSFAVTAIALLTASCIEIVVLQQPDVPTSVYQHAHGLKGVVRYFSHAQEQAYSVARPIMIAGFVVSAILAATSHFLLRADYNRRLDESLRKSQMD
jgi:hypothetical protein